MLQSVPFLNKIATPRELELSWEDIISAPHSFLHWKSACQTNKNKTTCGIAPLKHDRALFARFLVVILPRPDLDIKETISTFELAEYPRALFFSDGSLRLCATKSKLMNILESLLPAQQQPQTSTVQPHSADPSSRQVVIIDAMAVVQAMGKPPWVRNGRDLASHFIEVIDSKSEGATEVHVVFDRYDIPNSLKEGTRQKRTGTSRAVVYKITVDAVIDKITMKDLLSCSQNKETLAIFLAAQLIECKKDSQTTYVVTSKADCMASNSLPIQHLRSEQEEADTRMLLHALDATQRGATSITIQSPDTDVLVLTLWVYKRLCPDTTVIVGTGGKRRSIPLGPLYEAVGEELVKALPGFHAFSGCDQTGTISGKSKVSCWNTLKKAERSVLDAFSSLGTTDTIPDDIYMTLERFVCQLYIPSTQLRTIGEVRWLLFSKKQHVDEQLPPTKAALHQMTRRANLVALVWKSCDNPNPSIPSPILHGWQQDGDRLQPVPTTLPPAPKAVLQLIKCGCKGICITMSCTCRNYNLKCTDMCGSCEVKCRNRSSNTDTVEHITGDISEDENLHI